MKQHQKGLALWLLAILLLLAGALLTGSPGRSESVQEAMRDAVLHDVNQVGLFGLMEVNPGMISAFVVTAVLLVAAVCIRCFVIPPVPLQPRQAPAAAGGMGGPVRPHGQGRQSPPL